MSGINKLGGLLQSQMHAVSKYNIGIGNIVFGTITSGKGLKMDGVDYTIPNGEYRTCLPYKKITLKNTGTAGLTDEELNVFNAVLTKCSIVADSELDVGDRVLVLIYSSEPVVIGFIK